MTVRFRVNDGSRPSRFTLGRYAAGELVGDEKAAVEAALADPAVRAELDAIEATRAVTPAFDFAAIRGRFEEVPPAAVVEVTPAPAPANRVRWLAPLVALAAAALIAVRLWPTPDDGDGLRVRGDGTVLAYELDGDVLIPYAGRPLAAGDVVGFKVRPGDFRGVVLVSVDGDGLASVLYPAEGNSPERIPGDGHTVELPGTITLDDAPGPEVIVAVFDRTVQDALEDAADRYEAGGRDALVAWGRDAHDVDTVVLERE
jgi:hypothetical protein